MVVMVRPVLSAPPVAPPAAGQRRRIPPGQKLGTHAVTTPQGLRVYRAADPVATAPRARSLVLGLHGGGGDARHFAHRSGLIEALGVLGHDIVFPQARSYWADGRRAIETGWPDDRALIEALVRQAARSGPEAVPLALVGASNGGMFAQRLACEMTLPPRAVVAVTAALPAAYAAQAPAGLPVPVMLVQATEDAMMPWQGGAVPQVGGHSIAGRLLSADATVAFWCRRNRCETAPRLRHATISGVPVEISVWSAGPGGADVWRVVLRGAGHGWLGRKPGTGLHGSLEELVARFLLWYLDRERLASGEPQENLE